MFNHDAGHTHGPTPHFVTGCPLCDAAKNARNQAIGHLAEALRLMAAINPSGTLPTIRLNLGPIGITGDDAQNCHSVDLTAKHAEALSDAVDSMNAHASSQPAIDQSLRDLADGIEAAIPADEASVARRKARFMGWLQGQSGEAIESGEWSAAAVAHNDTDLWDQVNDAFAELDHRAITKDVLDETKGSKLKLAKTLLLDEWFGDIADAYADEDEL